MSDETEHRQKVLQSIFDAFYHGFTDEKLNNPPNGAMRVFILLLVKFRSRWLTALNLLPSIATVASVNKPQLRHSTMNSRHTFLIAAAFSARKSASVLKSGASRPTNHISSRLRPASCSSRREDWIRFKYPYR